ETVEVELPDAQVGLAGFDRGVLHAVLRRELCHRLPTHVGVLDIGLLVELEEIELRGAEVEELGPALALEAEPAALPEFAMAVSGDVDALGAGVGDDALDPVPAAHEALPGSPGDLGRGQRLRRADLLKREADMRAELLQDLPMCLAMAVRVVGDHLLGAGADDIEPGVPIRAVGGDAQ